MRGIKVLISVAALVAAVAVPSLAVAQTGEVGPRLRVGLGDGEAIFGDAWQPSIAVTVTAVNPATPLAGFSVVVTSDDSGGFMLPTGFDGLQPGWLITATDGVDTKTHTVKNISITDVDLATNVVSGTAEPGAVLDYVGSGQVFEGQRVQAGGDGTWSVDLTSVYDVRPGGLVVALQIDDPGCVAAPFEGCDADFTHITWYVPITLDQLLDNMVADGELPTAGIANSIMKMATGAPEKTLTSYLKGLIKARKVTQQTVDEILAAVYG